MSGSMNQRQTSITTAGMFRNKVTELPQPNPALSQPISHQCCRVYILCPKKLLSYFWRMVLLIDWWIKALLVR